MPVRVTGMISGLDTEALVSAMVSAYGVKKKKSEKNVQTIKWKQEAWTGINAKVKSLYSSVGNLRFTSAYSLKKATVSDPTKATVSAGADAVIGSQKLKVKQLATAGYLTGAKLEKQDGSAVKTSTKLSELKGGFDVNGGSISVTVGGKTKNIEINQDTTIGNVVNALKDAGLSANYDEKNGRIFVAAQKSGKENDFSLVANSENGLNALNALGLNVASTANKDMYNTYYRYGQYGGSEYLGSGRTISMTDRNQGIQDINDIRAGIEADKALITSYKEANAVKRERLKYAENLKAVNESKSKLNNSGDANELEKLLSEGNFGKYVANDYASSGKTYDREEEIKDSEGNVTGYKYYYKTTDANGDEIEASDEFASKLQTVSERAGDLVKATNLDEFKSEVQDTDANGDPIVDGNGDPVMRQEFDNAKISSFLSGMASRLNNMKSFADGADGAYASTIDSMSAQDLDDYITAENSLIETNNTYITNLQKNVDANKLADNDMSAEDLYDKIKYQHTMYQNLSSDAYHADEIAAGTRRPKVTYSEGAVRVNAVDAEIELNGAAYTSDSNSFAINGLSINVTGLTDDEGVTITTDTDSQAIYDKVKDFLKQYNEIMTEMAKLYNASSAKGYEPLSEEEKDAMSDKEVEKWEQKIKDASLRKDSSLNSIMYTMSMAMSQRYQINGKYYSLSSFGIKTKNYFETDDNDNYEYHIDGDKDDKYSSGNADKLLAAITADPDGVVEFFKNLSTGLYDSLDKKMKGTTMSSTYSVYNDKQMKQQLSGYEKEVTDWEKKIKDYEDFWYRKYATMESTLAKLQSRTSALGNMMG